MLNRVLEIFSSTGPSNSDPKIVGLKRGAFLTLFGVMCGHALLETARDALFLAKIPATQLPKLYLIVAVLAVVVTTVSRRWKENPRDRLVVTQIFAACVTFWFWWAMDSQETWLYYALYIWSAVIVSVIVVYFWVFLGELFTISQSKRIFASVGTGGALGALAGFGLANVLTRLFEPEALIGASALAFMFSTFGTFVLARRQAEPLATPITDAAANQGGNLIHSIGEIAKHPYARKVASLTILSAFTLTLVGYLFKSTVAEEIPAEQLGRWFAGYYFIINTFSLLLLAFVVTPVIRRTNIHSISAALPALLAVAALGILLSGSLLSIIALKSIDGTLRYSLLKTCRELLYLPIVTNLRSHLKAFADILGSNIAKAAASIAILQVIDFEAHNQWIAGAILVLSVYWVYAALRLREPYLDVFRESLNQGEIQTRTAIPELDLASLETLIRSLSHPDERHVIAALDLLNEKHRIDLVPSLILYHPSTAVVSKALDLFARDGREDYLSFADHLLLHDEATVRAATVRAIWVVKPEQQMLEGLLASECPCIQASAAVGLVSNGWASASSGRSADALWKATNADDVDDRLAVANAILLRPQKEFFDFMLALQRDPNTDVRRTVIKAMCLSGDISFTSVLVDLLDDRDVREDVRHSLLERGEEAIAALDKRLSSSNTPASIALHIPHTLAMFDNSDVVEILVRQLECEPSGRVKYKILLALESMLKRNPALKPDVEPIRKIGQALLGRGLQLLHWEAEMSRALREESKRKTPASELLLELLADKRRLTAERIFRLLYLFKPDENFRRIWNGLQAKDPRTRDHAEELLDNLLPSNAASTALAIAENGLPEQLLASASPELARRKLSYEELLMELSSDRRRSLQGIAIYHSAEIAESTLPANEAQKEMDKKSAALDLLIHTTPSNA